MHRSFGFQQQGYAVHQEAQVQQSYSMHQEAWHSNNQYHNHFQGRKLCPGIDSQLLKHDNSSLVESTVSMSGWHRQDGHQNGWYGTSGPYIHVSLGKRVPFNGLNASQFSHGAILANGMEENAVYETFHGVHVPPTVRVQEMRYERSSCGDNGHHFGTYDENINLKYNGHWKAERVPKGL